MRYAFIMLAFIVCLIWSILSGFGALVISTGLADTPGDTNGLLRFAKIMAFAIPGMIGVYFSARALWRIDRSKRGQPGFEIRMTK